MASVGTFPAEAQHNLTATTEMEYEIISGNVASAFRIDAKALIGERIFMSMLAAAMVWLKHWIC